MATLHGRDLSESTLATLKVRAAKAGQSLQAYIRTLLNDEAESLAPSEAAERARQIAARTSVTAIDVVDAIAQVRHTRE